MCADASSQHDLPTEVQSWLDEHPEADADTLRDVWRLSGTVPPTVEPDPERVSSMREALQRATATDRVHEAAEASSRPAPRAARADDHPAADTSRTSQSRTLWAAGAALLILLLSASVYYLAVPARVAAPAGQTRTVTLADGSQVQLNSGTTLQYPQWWSVDLLRAWFGRSVQLSGEAFFTVSSTGTPFRVETQNAQVRVLGTRFNVRARQTQRRPETQVVVAKGKVALVAAGKTTHLDSAESSTVQGTAPPSPAQPVRVAQRLAWRRGGISFTNASLQTIGAELERRFDVRIAVLLNGTGQSVTLHVDEVEGPGPLLRDICRTAGCRVEATSNGFTIRAGPQD